MELREMKQALDLVRQNGKAAEKALEALKIIESADAIQAQVRAAREEYAAAAKQLADAKDATVKATYERDAMVEQAAAARKEAEQAKVETAAVVEASLAQSREAGSQAAASLEAARVAEERAVSAAAEVASLEERRAKLEAAIAVLKNG